MRVERLVVAALFLAAVSAQVAETANPRKSSFSLRGVTQTFYLYDAASNPVSRPAAVVVSGDGGWHGFIAEVAEYLAARGYPVVGMDAKEYLSTMSKPKALEPSQVSSDFAAIATYAKQQTATKTFILVGWSEGAGLAVLGGLDPVAQVDLRGVVAIGLPELNELAWRWSDAVIYVTKKVPNEPTFNSKDYVSKLAPLPLAMIQSTHDDFVPTTTAREIFARAAEPKQFAPIEARNHRFEGARAEFWQALDRALAWFDSLAPKTPR